MIRQDSLPGVIVLRRCLPRFIFLPGRARAIKKPLSSAREESGSPYRQMAAFQRLIVRVVS
jgi:hypothetical protein